MIYILFYIFFFESLHRDPTCWSWSSTEASATAADSVASFSRISPPRSSSEAAISSAYGERWPGGKNMGKTMEKPMENGGFYGG
jgi:hypothetical protein